MQEQQQTWKEKTGATSPRDFLLKHIGYLPWVALSIAFALTLGWLKLRYSIPYYSSKGSMLIREDKASENDKMEALLQDRQSVNIRNEVEVLKSSILARRVVKALGLQTQYLNIGKVKYFVLYKDSPFQLRILGNTDSLAAFSLPFIVTDNSHFKIKDNQNEYLFGESFNYAGNQLQVLLVGNGMPMAYESKEYVINWMPLEAAIGLVNDNLNVAIVNNNTSILSFNILSEHPQMAADIINQLIKEFNTANVEEKNQTSFNTLRFIDERLDTIKNELSAVEQAIQKFTEHNKAVNLEVQTRTYIDNLAVSGNQVIEQQVKLKIVNYLIDYLNNTANIYRTVPSTLVVEEPTLPPLINSYNQLQLEHQSKIQSVPIGSKLIQNLELSIEKLRQDIVENLNNVKNAYTIALNSIQNKNIETESQLLSLPGKGKQLAEISRQQKILEDLYKFLLTKRIETSISSASTIANSRVLEPAVASWIPVKPDKKATYFIAFFFGLAVPVSVIALKEYLNDKIESRVELEKLTPVPIIGEVGHVNSGETLIVRPGNRSYVAEQFRMIRTNLQFVMSKAEKPVILISSSFSGEGKSFVATNIGAVMAMAGKRTVILELDIRKPKVTAGLDLLNRKGITNYIVANLDLNELPVAVPDVENLYVIPCGPLPPNPAELLMDERLDKLVAWAKKEFDVVIMDSAPVGLVSDSMILSRFVDCTLYLVRQQYTFKKQAELMNSIYEGNKFNKMFIVLNDVKAQNGYGNYYGYGYGYGYGRGNEYFEDDSNGKARFFLGQMFRRIGKRKQKI